MWPNIDSNFDDFRVLAVWNKNHLLQSRIYTIAIYNNNDECCTLDWNPACKLLVYMYCTKLSRNTSELLVCEIDLTFTQIQTVGQLCTLKISAI